MVFGLALGLALTGCGGGPAQRTGYEMAQNVGQQDCRKDPAARCPERQGYDDYQRQRKALESK